MTTTDQEFLHTIKMQLSGGKPITMSHETALRLISLATTRKVLSPSYESATTDLRVPAAANGTDEE